MGLATLNVGRRLEPALVSGHPWVYRNHLPTHRLRTGDWVRLEAGRAVAHGLYDAEGAIAVRLFRREAVPDDAFLRRRVAQALELRQPLTAASDTNAYRLLHGEGDYLPAIVADRYGRFAVMRRYAASVDGLLPGIARELGSSLGLKGVVLRGEAGLRPLWGEPPPPRERVMENGLSFDADLTSGQKTGLFLDQRDNRELVRELAQGRSVLNLFSYTGGFSVYALAGGARRVVSVDVSEAAAAEAERTVAVNGLDAKRHESIAADAFAFLPELQRRGERFDMVILDPPALAHNAEQRRRAQRAYFKLNRAAFAALEPGGLLVTASCTAQVSPDVFQRLVADAALAAAVEAQFLLERGQPRDHPVPTSFPEGRYLKFLVVRALAG